jgi:hypothetical protein
VPDRDRRTKAHRCAFCGNNVRRRRGQKAGSWMYSTKFRELKTEIPVGMSDTFGCQAAGRSGPIQTQKMGGVQVGAA